VLALEGADEIAFSHVLSHAGHSTYRMFVHQWPRFDEYWSPIQAMGCSYEEGIVLAVDVPPASDIEKVYSLLEAGEDSGVWGFEEGHCGHTVGRG